MVSWTCRRALLNWPTLRSGGVFRLRGATAISQQARAAEGLLGKMSSRSILEGELLWQDLAVMHPPPGARRWQNAREMRSLGVRQWQDIAVVCFRAVGHGNISPWCIPERSPMTEMCSPASDSGKISPRCVFGRRSVAAFSLHAFPKGPRTGKSPVRGKIRAPCIQNELASARYARHASEKPCERAFGNVPRKYLAMKGPLSLRGPLRSCTARGSCRCLALAGLYA